MRACVFTHDGIGDWNCANSQYYRLVVGRFDIPHYRLRSKGPSQEVRHKIIMLSNETRQIAFGIS